MQGTRSVVLSRYTLMSQIASTRKWTPWRSDALGDTTGLQYPSGIYMGDDHHLGARGRSRCDPHAHPRDGALRQVDFNQLVFDLGPTGILAANTLVSIPTVPTNFAITANQWLIMRGIYVLRTYNVDTHEN